MPRPVLLVHPSAELYGSDRVFAESVRALADSGREVLVALPADGPLVPLLRSHGARVLRCPTPVLRKSALRPSGLLGLLRDCLSALPAMLRLLSRHRFEAVYVSTVTLPLWPPMARLFGRRVVAHVHEAEDTVPRPIRVGLALPLLCCHVVVANSAAARGVLLGAVPRLRERVLVVRNGVHGPATPPEEPPATSGSTGLVLVGRISPRKGTDTAVRAVALLRERGRAITLDLVGSVFAGYEWFERELEELVREHRLEEVVRSHGFDDDVWSHYAAADVVLVPSRMEPFGNTAVEAQLAMRPVVVTDAQGLPETVDGGRRGSVVPTDDPHSLADRIEELLDDWEEARRRARHARLEAARLFAPEHYRRSIRELFETSKSR
ncbi:glycosyltransferase family 4 protein [Actinopolyspora sp. BKK1]|uniref:glycosyltransferase family 4 protein n=1 Tax=unclassified Actinopolyspora TaxID=2639451 RepID=UPI00325B8985